MSNLLIYQSSAGSGKTYKLAKEYLKLAFKYPGAFKNILAITFTNKATEEMKSRVLNFLINLSDGKDNILEKQLIEEGVKGDIEELAKVTLNSILHNYSDFSISTIDSFFNRVLRSFAKELKLQVGYKIELNQKEVLKEITKLLLKDLNKDEELRKYLEDFILMKISEDRGWDIERDIIKLGGEIFKERYWEKKFNSTESSGEKEISDNRKKIKVLMNDIMYIVKNFEDYLKKIGDEAEKVMNQYKLEVDDFSNKEKGVGGFLIYKIRNKKDYELKTLVLKAYDSVDGWYTKTSKKKEIISKALDDGLYNNLKTAIEFIQKESAKYYSAKVLKNTFYTLGIFEDLISKLNDYRKTNRILLQSDVNSILQGLISTDNSPFIYEKIGSNYKNLLIDEFQDTSTFQWKNLLPLLINVLSEKNTALVAGDVKQSIYRWRSGNMKLLLSQIYKDLEGFKELIKTEYLKLNRRSRKEIIEFNNRFFQKAIEEVTKDIKDEDHKKLMIKAYSDEGLLQDNEKQGGYVNITFFDYDIDDISTQEKAEQKVLEIVKEILENGYLLSDILVLVRKNEEVRRVSSVLTKSGYDIVSTESLLVNNSPKVRLIVDLVKYILDNKNILAKTDALYNYLEFISNKNVEYSKIFEGEGKGFIENLPKEFFKENEIPKIKSILNDLNIYEVTENLIHIFGFDKSPDSYLFKFQDIIFEYSMENNPDLKSFTEWWEEKKNEFSIDSPSNINAVNIMTIHKAKGLQGKNVILPYANWKINIEGTKDLIWVSADEEPFNKSAAYPVKATTNLKNTFFFKDYNYEFAQTRLDNLNLLYVAFTRAKDRMYVIVPVKKTKDNVGNLLKEIISNNTSFNNNVYETGNKDKAHEREDESEIRTEKLKHFISTEWYKKTIIKPKHKKLREFTDKDFASKVNRGVILHEVLSHIKTINDIDAAINKVLIEGVITEEEKEKVKQSIEVLLENKIIQNWFSDEWEVKSETDILVNGGNVLRPDRVIIKEKNAIVIDYKTGFEKEEHKKQIRQYAEALNRMGFTDVTKYLLYINEEIINNVKIVEIEK
jgi:ATP-dependent helicase/nuclease subunit A